MSARHTNIMKAIIIQQSKLIKERTNSWYIALMYQVSQRVAKWAICHEKPSRVLVTALRC